MGYKILSYEFFLFCRARIIFIFLVGALPCLYSSSAGAQQLFKYYNTDNGLSDRRVYSITQDADGFVWFLTENGVDRFDGLSFKHYPLQLQELFPVFLRQENTLQVDNKGALWQLNSKGIMYHYRKETDRFHAVDLRRNNKSSRYSLIYLDQYNRLWTGDTLGISFYHTDTGRTRSLCFSPRAKNNPTCLEAINRTHFFLGTTQGIFLIEMRNRRFGISKLLTPRHHVNQMHYNPLTKQLVYACVSGELYCYTLPQKGVREQLKKVYCIPNLITQNIIQSSEKDNQLLIATNGGGVFSLLLPQAEYKPYMQADYTQENKMPSDNITAIYMDAQHHVWMAGYPNGVFMASSHYPEYTWMRNQIGNTQSLCNNHVSDVLEDTDGDIWFATANGISIYSPRQNSWHTVLSKQTHPDIHSHIFLSLCEVSPGHILTAGYLSGAYWIDKQDWTVHYITPSTYRHKQEPNKYIRCIYRDDDDVVWIGGYFHLSKADWKRHQFDVLRIGRAITTITQRNKHSLWVGTQRGLFVVDTQKKRFIAEPKALSDYSITSLYNTPHALYIGTNGNGLYVYANGKLKNYRKETSALRSNNIYTLLQDPAGNIVCSTENGLTRFMPKNQTFYNWSANQGLNTYRFNMASGVHTSRGTFIFGGTNGAVEFADTARLPRKYHIKFYLDKVVMPNPDNNNNLTVKLGCINYDNPDCMEYQWRLVGKNHKWSTPTTDNIIRYAGLPAGEYKLQVRALNVEDGRVIDTKAILFQIMQPWYLSGEMIVLYLLLFALVCYGAHRHLYRVREQLIAKQQGDFFMQITHDIRTPLTLIKTPLELALESTADEHIRRLLQTALRSSDKLQVYANDLLQMQKAHVFTKRIKLEPTHLRNFIESILQPFKVYVDERNIELEVCFNLATDEVWIDRNKMSCVIQNLLDNAIKFTPNNGHVSMCVQADKTGWDLRIEDDGPKIQEQDKKRLFNLFERNSNKSFTLKGFGIGLNLVKTFVERHRGHIEIEDTETDGCAFVMNIPLHPDDKCFINPVPVERHTADSLQNRPKLLIVEDDLDLLNFLQLNFSGEYQVTTATDGDSALRIMETQLPDIIVSDVMMEPMSGKALCQKVKTSERTSHIPVVLLSALNDDESRLSGYDCQADQYITKPFSFVVLSTNLRSILENRNRIYQNIAKEAPLKSGSNLYTSEALDLQFIKLVEQSIHTNITNQEYNVDDLCRALHMSRSSLFTKVKALTGVSPSDYIRKIRIEFAQYLLIHSNDPIADIAYRCGFNDTKYFRMVFKKYTGISPTIFRLNNKKR